MRGNWSKKECPKRMSKVAVQFARMNPTAPKLAVSCHEASKKIAVNAT